MRRISAESALKLRICFDIQIIYLYNICIREAFHISCQNILLRKIITVTIRMVETILKVSVSRGYYNYIVLDNSDLSMKLRKYQTVGLLIGNLVLK